MKDSVHSFRVVGVACFFTGHTPVTGLYYAENGRKVAELAKIVVEVAIERINGRFPD